MGERSAADRRQERRWGEKKKADQRQQFERDRDRILYSSAFRRLAGVTQVVASGEGHVFHNRLTHSMKAAQIGRRLAEHILRTQTAEAELVGIDAEVVEAAALAHDLGHPPFGHAGEKELNRLVLKEKGDGYEGNAQSFRILVRLACRWAEWPGLNLTRATLNATIKYPCFWKQGITKWNVYRPEKNDFEFARRDGPSGKSAEAQLMELADDIAYSVHDLEDSYRAGLVPPLDRLCNQTPEREEFLARAEPELEKKDLDVEEAKEALAFLPVMTSPALAQPYRGTRDQRVGVRRLTSALINRFILGVRIRKADQQNPVVKLPKKINAEVTVLKQIMASYVFCHPSLVAQQYGHRKVVGELFAAFLAAATGGANDRNLLPIQYRELLESEMGSRRATPPSRFAADVVASLTEQQAIQMHRRLTGFDFGTVRDGIIA